MRDDGPLLYGYTDTVYFYYLVKSADSGVLHWVHSHNSHRLSYSIMNMEFKDSWSKKQGKFISYIRECEQ